MALSENFVFFIPNAIKPYGYEMINILAYPNGFKYRFRFDEEWVDDKIKYSLSDLIGKKACIVLRDMDSANLYPIRFCKIVEARKIGSIIYFEYEMDDIVDYDSKRNLRDQQVKQFEKDFLEFHKDLIKENNPGKNMSPLVFLSNLEINIENRNYSGTSAEKSFEQWGNVISIIKDIKDKGAYFYEDVEFIRIVDIERVSKSAAKAQIINNAFQLCEDEDYTIRLFQMIPKRKAYSNVIRDIQVLVDEHYLNPARDEQRAVGKYDVLSFVIRTLRRSGGRKSFIDIKHVVKNDAASAIEPKIHLPIFIKKSARWTFVSLAIIFAFFIVYISPKLITNFVNLDERVVKDMSIISITLAIGKFLREITDYIRG